MRAGSGVAERVTDPELPMLSLADLGVLRDVDVVGDSHVVVDITPTYSGCPAMAAMRDDLVRELTGAGFDRVEVRVSLDPPWTTDWITPAGTGRARRRRHLAARPGAVDHGPDPAVPAAHRAPGALPAVRLARDRAGLGVRLDGLQGAVPLHRVPRAVRPRQGDLSGPWPARPSTGSPSATSSR